MNNKIYNLRENFEKHETLYNKAENIAIKKEIIQNINCYWFNNEENSNSDKLIIYLHGGGFVLGSIISHRSLVSHIAEHLSLPVLFVEYSLAPEHPFPSAVDETLTVYNYLVHKYPEKDIIFMGDSAGGGLSLSVLSNINKKGVKTPANLVLLSPWIDLTGSNKSILMNANSDPVLTKNMIQDLAALYVGNQKMSDANPFENLYGQFPPTIIFVGSGEILLDDSKFLYNKILEQGVKVKLSIYEKQPHVWPLEDIHTKESINVLREIKEFIAD